MEVPVTVTDHVIDGYLQLGIAGATLVILLIAIILMFWFMKKWVSKDTAAQTSRIDKLCDKIDTLVTSYHENTLQLSKVTLANDKDQKATLNLLTQLLNVLLDVQKKVVRIDDRTYACLKTPNYEKEVE